MLRAWSGVIWRITAPLCFPMRFSRFWVRSARTSPRAYTRNPGTTRLWTKKRCAVPKYSTGRFTCADEIVVAVGAAWDNTAQRTE